MPAAVVRHDGAHERPEAPPLGDERGEPGRLQRFGRDRADGRHQQAPRAGRSEQVAEHLLALRRGEPPGGARRRGEQHGIHFAGRRGDHRACDGIRVGGRTPSVDREADDVGARVGEQVVEPVGARSVVLHRDAAAVEVLGQQELAELGRRLGFGDPVGREPGLLDRPAGLRATRDDLRGRERGQQRVEQPRFFGGLHPAAEADARRDDDDVGRGLDERARRRDQRLVVDVRQDAEGRGSSHVRTVPLERGRELGRAPIDGDDDRAALQSGGQRRAVGARHRAAPSTS